MVFSDETLTVFEHADPETYSQIAERFTRWTDIDIHHRGTATTSGGHGFSAIGRRELLRILQERAVGLGADVRFCTPAPSLQELGWADLIVGADGASSAVRTALARDFIPSLDRRQCRYIWLGTDLVFEAFKFFIAETEHGVVQAHAYPYDEGMSTFIVEMHERTWKRLGLGELSIDDAVEWCSERFADALEGHRLYSNNSRWINFVTVRNRRWCADNVVLLGDAAHTAHFSIGSGTKLAMEDAVALAWAFRSFGDDVAAATAAYEAERRPVVESTQRAAQGSLEWFEGIGRYVDQEPAPVRLQPAHAKPARDLRQPAAARSRSSCARCIPIRGRRCSPRSSCAGWSWRTGSSCRRWTCTPPSTGRPATSTSCTSGRARSAAPDC